MRKTYDVLVYPAGCQDYATEGLCGPVPCESCIEVQQGAAECAVDLEIPYDAEGRWKYIVPGNTLKCWTQMPLPPIYAVKGESTNSFAVVSLLNVARASLIGTARTRGYTNLYACSPEDSAMLVRLAMLTNDDNIMAPRVEGGAWPVNGYYHVYTSVGSGWVPRADIGWDASAAMTEAEARDILGEVGIRPQLYVIESVERTAEGLTVHAKHVFYRLNKAYTNGVEVSDDLSIQDFLNRLLRSTWFHYINAGALLGSYAGYTDSTLTSRLDGEYERYMVLCYTLAGSVLLDQEKGYMARYKLPYVFRDNFEVYFPENYDFSRWPRAVLEIGKNLTGISVLEDWRELATYVVPVFTDPQAEALETCDEAPMARDDADLYDQKWMNRLDVDVSDLDWQFEHSTYQEVLEQAKKRAYDKGMEYLNKAKSNALVSISVDVDQVDIAADYGEDVSAEQKIIELLEPLPVYATVGVIAPGGERYEAMILRREWDCLHGRMVSCELGQPRGASAQYAGIIPFDYEWEQVEPEGQATGNGQQATGGE